MLYYANTWVILALNKGGDSMKDRFNKSLQVVNLLIKGEISSLCFYKVKYDEDDCLKDDRVVEVMITLTD